MDATLSQREFTLGEEEIRERAKLAAGGASYWPARLYRLGAEKALRDLAKPLHQLKQERGE